MGDRDRNRLRRRRHGQGHGDGVNKLLRTDLRRAMALIIYRNSDQCPQANTQPSSDTFHVSSCDPAFFHFIPDTIPHSRTSSFMLSRRSRILP